VIPGEKFDEFGLHAHKYYKVDHSFFKSGLDTTLLDRLWNEYWVHTLSSSPLLSNQDIICKSVINVVDKMTLLHSKQGGFFSRRDRASSGTFGPSKVIDEEKYDPIAAESSKVAVDVTHGILTEALKKFMFACKQAESAARSEDAEMREESKKA
jgi:COP9 signalosome complex subunit 5